MLRLGREIILSSSSSWLRLGFMISLGCCLLCDQDFGSAVWLLLFGRALFRCIIMSWKVQPGGNSIGTQVESETSPSCFFEVQSSKSACSSSLF